MMMMMMTTLTMYMMMYRMMMTMMMTMIMMMTRKMMRMMMMIKLYEQFTRLHIINREMMGMDMGMDMYMNMGVYMYIMNIAIFRIYSLHVPGSVLVLGPGKLVLVPSRPNRFGD